MREELSKRSSERLENMISDMSEGQRAELLQQLKLGRFIGLRSSQKNCMLATSLPTRRLTSAGVIGGGDDVQATKKVCRRCIDEADQALRAADVRAG